MLLITLKDLPRIFAALVTQESHQWADEFRLESLYELFRHNSGGHTRASNRGDNVAGNVAALAFNSQGLAHTNKSQSA